MSVCLSAVEKVFKVRSLSVAGKLWQLPKTIPTLNVLCLHGWLDNANSFDHLAPQLTERFGANVFALDLCGHGKSDWLPQASFYYQTEYAAFALSVLGKEGLDWIGPEKPPCMLIGHSMGAGIATVVAGSFPEYFDGLVFLDGVGPVSESSKRAPAQFRSAFLSESASKIAKDLGKSQRRYADLDEIVARRQAAVSKFPGKQKISYSAAKTILERGTKLACESGVDGRDGSLVFTHDPRLNNGTPLRFNEEQVRALLENISCPTTAVLASSGWPSSNRNGGPVTIFQILKGADTNHVRENDFEVEENLWDHPRLRILKHLKHPVRLENSFHHLHIEPETQTCVVDLVSDFIANHVTGKPRETTGQKAWSTDLRPPDGM
jgi:pimeloyl-ACP methyl ester carboxylesterase